MDRTGNMEHVQQNTEGYTNMMEILKYLRRPNPVFCHSRTSSTNDKKADSGLHKKNFLTVGGF